MIYIPLKKICPVCNKNLIDYKDKHCPACNKRVEREKKEQWQYYDKNVRRSEDNLKYTEFYHSKEWITTTELIKQKYKYLDIYDYYINNQISYGRICHHILPIKTTEGWNQRLNINGIIYLSDSNHEKIHIMMEKDFEGTVKVMYDLVNRWNKEFNINL